jgi:predicted PurR-regulated permease PerM
VLSTVAGAGEITIDLLAVLVLAYFLAADISLGSRLLQSLTPAGYQPRAEDLLSRLRFRLTRWVWAQLAIALFFALAFGIGATLLGVPFALTIALVGGVLEIIPYVGGAVAMTLGVFSALTVNPWLALWVFVLYLVIAQVQSHIVAPAFYGRAMDLHPAVVLVALLIGAKAGGLVGVFFAVPIAVVLITLLQEWQSARVAVEIESVADEPKAALHV